MAERSVGLEQERDALPNRGRGRADDELLGKVHADGRKLRRSEPEQLFTVVRNAIPVTVLARAAGNVALVGEISPSFVFSKGNLGG